MWILAQAPASIRYTAENTEITRWSSARGGPAALSGSLLSNFLMIGEPTSLYRCGSLPSSGGTEESRPRFPGGDGEGFELIGAPGVKPGRRLFVGPRGLLV